jgi:raffinose/stachyose/melibiose transport system substrate-binding protein
MRATSKSARSTSAHDRRLRTRSLWSAAGAATLIAAVGVPVGASSASATSTAPTASITLWAFDQGTNLDPVWDRIATKFDNSHPGDHVNIVFQSALNSYWPKILDALSTSNPPDLFWSLGGGRMQSYIQAGKAQPFADPGENDAGSPTWKKAFVLSSLGAVTFGGKVYGMPAAGTQPVLFFYNKSVLAHYHLGFPATVPELLSDVKALASHNTTAIALGNLDQWEGLMYLEYFADREGGPQVFLNIQSNEKGAWSNPAILKALSDIQTLVNGKAFEVGYDAITWVNGFTDALVYRGVASMQLMGDWDLSGLLTENPSFVKSNQLGVASFPTVPGGKGNPADLEGNTTGYVGLAAHISPAATYVSEQFADYAFTTQSFAKAEVAAGNIPVIAGSAGLLNASPLKNYLEPIYQSVVHAPYFQYSWDQALGPTKAVPMLANLAKVFELSETPKQFASIMNGYQT